MQIRVMAFIIIVAIAASLRGDDAFKDNPANPLTDQPSLRPAEMQSLKGTAAESAVLAYEAAIHAADDAFQTRVSALKEEYKKKTDTPYKIYMSALRKALAGEAQRGKLDAALAIKQLTDWVDKAGLPDSPAVEAATRDTKTPPNAKRAVAGDRGLELLDTMEITGGRWENGAILLRQGQVATATKYKPPVAFKIIAQTDSTNVRVRYDSELIFNWEVRVAELCVVGGPAGGRNKEGVGQIPVGKWVEIILVVQPDSIVVSVNGEERYRTDADFSRTDEPLSIYPSHGSTIQVKSVRVIKLPQH